MLILGAALRFWNIQTGLPYRIGPDEPVIAERAIHIMRTGNFHPQFFDYPGLSIYLQVIVGCIVFVAGAMGYCLPPIEPTPSMSGPGSSSAGLTRQSSEGTFRLHG